MPEAVGSTFGGGGLAGLVFFVLYLVFGPGAVIFHAASWAFHRYSVAFRGRATLKPSELQTIRQCLPWNIVITLIPVARSDLGTDTRIAAVSCVVRHSKWMSRPFSKETRQ